MGVHCDLKFRGIVYLTVRGFHGVKLGPIVCHTTSDIVAGQRRRGVKCCNAVTGRRCRCSRERSRALFVSGHCMRHGLRIVGAIFRRGGRVTTNITKPTIVRVFNRAPFSPRTGRATPSCSRTRERLSLLFDDESKRVAGRCVGNRREDFAVITCPIPRVKTSCTGVFSRIVGVGALSTGLCRGIRRAVVSTLSRKAYMRMEKGKRGRASVAMRLCRLGSTRGRAVFRGYITSIGVPIKRMFASPILRKAGNVLRMDGMCLSKLRCRGLGLAFRSKGVASCAYAGFRSRTRGGGCVCSGILGGRRALPLNRFTVKAGAATCITTGGFGVRSGVPVLVTRGAKPRFTMKSAYCS